MKIHLYRNRFVYQSHTVSSETNVFPQEPNRRDEQSENPLATGITEMLDWIDATQSIEEPSQTVVICNAIDSEQSRPRV